MDASLIQSLFNFITNYIFHIIYLFAIVEVYLIISIYMMLKKHQNVLLDVSDNLLKGFTDAPDKDSSQHVHEKIQSAIQFITNKISLDPEIKKDFRKNAEKINERPFYNRHYKIESYSSVMSTIVQIFPLLGILGTILAIAKTAFQTGSQIDFSSLSNAFVLAMDTTILGIGFSVLFMVIDGALQPKIDRVVDESSEYRNIISKIYLS